MVFKQLHSFLMVGGERANHKHMASSAQKTCQHFQISNNSFQDNVEILEKLAGLPTDSIHKQLFPSTLLNNMIADHAHTLQMSSPGLRKMTP